MKQIITLFAICFFTVSAYTQEKQTSTTTNPIGTDFIFMYSSKAEDYGVGFQADMSEFLYLEWVTMSNLKFGNDDINTFISYFGFGAQHRYRFGESFIINFHLAPYIGLSSITYDHDDDTKFAYGATADIKAAFKLFETKKGNDYFLNIGYKIYANEFKTKDILKYGYFNIGITYIPYWNK